MGFFGYPIAIALLFAPLAFGGVYAWTLGIIHLLIMTAMVLNLLQRGPLSLPATPLGKPIVALLILSTCSLLFSVHHYTSIVASFSTFFYVILYCLVLKIKRSGLVFLVYWIIGIAALLCIIGLLAQSGIYVLPWHQSSAYPQHGLTATFGNHNHLAGWLEMSLPLLLCLILFGCQRKWLLVQVLLLLLLALALVLTFSRGGWAGITAALLFIATTILLDQRRDIKKKSIIFVSIALGLGLLLLASPNVAQRVHTIGLSERVDIWWGTVDMIQEHWITGTGPGTYGLAFAKFHPPGSSHRYYTAHNDYLQFIAELGLGLVPLILWTMILLYRHGLTTMQSPDKLLRAIHVGSLAGITAIAVHSAVDFNLRIPANVLLFVLLLAFASTPTILQKNKEDHDPQRN